MMAWALTGEAEVGPEKLDSEELDPEAHNPEALDPKKNDCEEDGESVIVWLAELAGMVHPYKKNKRKFPMETIV